MRSPAFLISVAILLTLAQAAFAGSLLISGAKVYPAPGAAPIAAVQILISEGRILTLNPSADQQAAAERRIDAKGMVAVAGFWNCHVHFTEPHWLGAADLPQKKLEGQLQAMLTRYGFTAAVDTGSAPANTFALRSRIEAGQFGPEIHLYSGNFVAQGGSPAYLEVQLPELTSVEQAKAAATEVLGYGVDGLKIFTGSYLGEGQVAHLPLPLVQAVTETAHQQQAWVLAHPQSRQGLETAIDGGVDILAHTAPASGPWLAPLVERMVRSDMALIPTLKLWRFELERAARPAATVEAFQNLGVEQLRAFSGAGGEVLFGTDVGYMTDYDPTEEYQKLHQAGLDFHHILAALTSAPAARFRGDPERASRLEVGQPGDLVLLGSDPAHRPEAFADVRFTIRAGRVLFEAD